MEVDISKRNMRQIEENVRSTVKEFNERKDISTKFGDPVIAYLSTTHPMFDTFFARGENDHPKNVYRPGNTLIVHYVPWDDNVAKSNETQENVTGDGGMPSEEWKQADRESLWLAMEINKTIKKTLDKVGRIHSNTSSMVDWDMDRHRYGWSNKIAGFLGGIGSFGPAGSLHSDSKTGTASTYGGRVGSISTAALYADEDIEFGIGEEAFEKVMKDCCFKGHGASCSDEMIAACPGGAIEADGINRKKCQQWCLSIDAHTPAPEVCGKCFRFR